VPVPLLEEQKVITRRVEVLFAYADRLEARYAAAREQVEQLPPSLLAKAFRGELVPQNSVDEPTEENDRTSNILWEKHNAGQSGLDICP
jgi:type I restriction enzyme S subunit